MQTNYKEEYLKARSLALKEKKELESRGLSPFPAVLDELFPDVLHANVMDLPLQEIPAERIVGTVSAGRISAFSASFLPLPEVESEFAMKWCALLGAHLSDTGIREPIECYEYLGEFYVLEGNKRVSVLRYFGAPRIPAKIKRVLPAPKDDERVIAYYEFLDFHKATGIYDLLFRRSGGYARLLSAIGKRAESEWSESEKKRLSGTFYYFKEAFNALGKKDPGLYPEDALLLFLKVHSYGQLCEMSVSEIKKALLALWGDVRTAAEPEAVNVKTVPAGDEKKGLISKIISGAPRHLSIAFILKGNGENSTWTRGHLEGAQRLSSALGDAVSVRTLFNADTPERAEELIDEAVRGGAELIFTTTPPLLDASFRGALKYPKVRFYNCSAFQPLSSVISYYCRTYEGKFITGLIAGALAENDLVGYIGSYPIFGVPASINAFALGVSMTNPRAKVLLEWSCVEQDCVEKLREKGTAVISGRDVPLPGANYTQQGQYGTFLVNGRGELSPVASPVWMWGNMYERIVRSVLSGAAEKKEQAVNYWWGMDSGVIDVALSQFVPSGVRALAEHMMERLKQGSFDVFSHRLAAQDGSLISNGIRGLSTLEILRMDKLAETVVGSIPEYDEILPMSRALVRALGIHRERIPPED